MKKLLFILLYFIQALLLPAQDSTRFSTTPIVTNTITPDPSLQLSSTFLKQADAKADKYYKLVSSKTEKTLEKLSKWENKIKALLEKASPATAQQLFGNGQITFTSLLQQYKEGKQVADNYKGQYDEYRDKLTTSLNYLEQQKANLEKKLVGPLQQSREKMATLNKELDNAAALQQFIKERRKQLLAQALQLIGKSKYLQKINKESFYYIETLKNYKEVFSNPKKAEELAMKLLC